MAGCCEDSCAVEALQAKQRGTLRAVLGINAVMFVVVIAAAIYAGSTALMADSLDNLGDALTYALSLYAVSRGALIKANVALFKGILIGLAALGVASQILLHLINPEVPLFEVMGIFSVLSLLANSLCLFLLWRHREDDLNMSSVWECSRNDIATNLSVLLTAGAVWLTDSHWPDIIIASALLVILLRSSIRIIAAALIERRRALNS